MSQPASHHETVCPPDLSSRPLAFTVDRTMHATPVSFYLAWTGRINRWCATPGTLLLRAEVNAVFFWEVQHEGNRHPHHGRFLRLEPGRLVELTWVTGLLGTQGAKTVVTGEFTLDGTGTRLQLTHAAFVDKESKAAHDQARLGVLVHLDEQIAA